MVFGHFSEESSPKTYMTTYDLLLFPSWIQVPDALELTTLNIPKTFKEIGFLDNALELQIWSCKVFDPNRHDADNVPIQRSVWLQAYAFKMAKNYNKASSCPHLPWLVDMRVRPYYWKYQGIDNVVYARAVSTGFKDCDLISQFCREIIPPHNYEGLWVIRMC